MSTVRTERLKGPFWTPAVYAMAALMGIGFVFGMIRFFGGLAAVTNLTDSYPWGIWKAVNVAAGVALATGGFTMAALVHIFHRERYAPLLRPALLVGLLGYTFGAVSLFIDIGRYYNIWHPMWPSMWQGDSALFEVAICIMTYLTILYVEFIPIICERYIGRVNLPGALARLNHATDRCLRFLQKWLNQILSAVLVLGVVLSCMHHSSLGSLMLVAKFKMSALWYTPILPLLFLMSVFAVGFAVVICESLAVSRAFGRRFLMEVLTPLSLYVLIFQGLYAIAKTSDLLIREAHATLLDGSPESILFLVEMIFGIFIPLGLLVSHRVRRSPFLLGIATFLVIFGVFMNRVNVFITAYRSPFAMDRYIPSFSEIIITIGLLSAFVLLHRIVLFVFPILAVNEEPHHSTQEAPVALPRLETAGGIQTGG